MKSRGSCILACNIKISTLQKPHFALLLLLKPMPLAGGMTFGKKFVLAASFPPLK